MPLFENRKEWAIFILFCMTIFSINLAWQWSKYQNFMDAGEQNLVARVKFDYIKTNERGRSYRVVRLETAEFEFYTIAGKGEKFTAGDTLNLVAQNTDISFLDWVSDVFYMPTSQREILGERSKSTQILEPNLQNYEPILWQNFENEPNFTSSETLNQIDTSSLSRTLNFSQIPPPAPPNRLKWHMLNFISSQHENPKISQLYAALFLGDALFGELRDDVAHWGVAHLIAISGYHLGVIMGVIFLLISPIYRYFSARYFPYRNYKFDITALALVVALAYLCLIGFIPSFIRALAMSAFGVFLLARDIKVLNHQTLFVVICACISMFPSLLFSVGFYFSCAGVYFIFLYLHYFRDKFGLIMHSWWLNLYVFFAMQIPVLYFFPLISFQQMAVVPLGYIFGVFYPTSFLAHLVGFGGIGDEWILRFLEFKFTSHQAQISLFTFVVFNAISLLALKFKPLVFAPIVAGVMCFVIFCIL